MLWREPDSKDNQKTVPRLPRTLLRDHGLGKGFTAFGLDHGDVAKELMEEIFEEDDWQALRRLVHEFCASIENDRLTEVSSEQPTGYRQI